MSFCSVPSVHVHANRVKLLQAGHGIEHHDAKSAPLHSLNRPAEDIRGDALKVLEHAHAKGLTQNFVGVLVVGVPDVL